MLRILVVERESESRSALSWKVRRIPDVECIVATGTEQAEQLAVDVVPDMVVCQALPGDLLALSVLVTFGRRDFGIPITLSCPTLGEFRTLKARSGCVEAIVDALSLDEWTRFTGESVARRRQPAPPLTPVDYLFASCVGAETVELAVHGELSGRLVVSAGSVWHAEDETGFGLEALGRLLGARGASVSIRSLDSSPGLRTVSGGWEKLVFARPEDGTDFGQDAVPARLGSHGEAEVTTSAIEAAAAVETGQVASELEEPEPDRARPRRTARIVIASQKGGVGKTTVALNLAVAMAEAGQSVLLADLDPQGGIGLSLARGDTELAGLADILAGSATCESVLLPTRLNGLTVLPRGRLDPLDVLAFEEALYGQGVLDEILARVERDVDVVIIDTPAGLGGATRAALSAGDFVVIPFQTEALALRSVQQLLRVIDRTREDENPRLRLLGIVPTMVDKSGEVAMSVLGDVWSGFSCVTDTVIPKADVFALASQRGVPVGYLSGPVSPEARRFDALASELQRLIAATSSVGDQDELRPERSLL